VNVAQGEPDAASNAALGSSRRHLKFDLEEIEGVHAEHGYRARTNACKRMVLQADGSSGSANDDDVPMMNVS